MHKPNRQQLDRDSQSRNKKRQSFGLDSKSKNKQRLKKQLLPKNKKVQQIKSLITLKQQEQKQQNKRDRMKKKLSELKTFQAAYNLQLNRLYDEIDQEHQEKQHIEQIQSIKIKLKVVVQKIINLKQALDKLNQATNKSNKNKQTSLKKKYIKIHHFGEKRSMRSQVLPYIHKPEITQKKYYTNISKLSLITLFNKYQQQIETIQKQIQKFENKRAQALKLQNSLNNRNQHLINKKKQSTSQHTYLKKKKQQFQKLKEKYKRQSDKRKDIQQQIAQVNDQIIDKNRNRRSIELSLESIQMQRRDALKTAKNCEKQINLLNGKLEIYKNKIQQNKVKLQTYGQK